ncbi:threonine-phosphate decarboxylase [Jeotgalibacillus sp. S-D1]|uniref:threonine-phosphate decarboxylase CobD n=1 Tax=Jeotgalibacillus sp. S-D1 TaxID=2552189 RepID=UPI00105A4DEC|nr:threonine-phosphate decarboxylase CobD [Jeotgalibacillus sp. S-D1]TDL32977.1 threonine-phosphate decarboxylase [Jeotgalibacillus sp. S-D1]
MYLPAHGANPHSLYKAMGIPVPESIIDFSENTNPLGPPSVINEKWMEWHSAVSSYPDPDGEDLRHKIAVFHQVEPSQVLLGNGAAELMMVTARLFEGKQVGIIHPAFSEYERVIKANKGIVHHFYTSEHDNWEVNDQEVMEFLTKDRALFICNPSNPTGMAVSADVLSKWISHAAQTGATILLDEAFVDMMGEEHSMSGYIGSDHLVIFRSMTKMFAIAGLRLGYMLGSDETLDKIKQWLPHWNVNALALLSGQAVLEDVSFQQMTRSYIKKERIRMVQALEKAGVKTSQSEANYFLLQPADAAKTPQLFKQLLKEGLTLRHTYNYKGLDGRWLRAGIKTAQQNDRLIQAVTKWQQEESSP